MQPQHQSERIITKLTVGGTSSLNVKTLNDNDANFSWAYHTLITVGSIDDVIKFTLNGVTVELPGGVEITRIPIKSIVMQSSPVTVIADEPGLLVLGEKTNRTLFT
jgi:hypothetical protein